MNAHRLAKRLLDGPDWPVVDSHAAEIRYTQQICVTRLTSDGIYRDQAAIAVTHYSIEKPA